MEVVNICRVSFEYKLSPTGHIIKNTVISNVVCSKIVNKVLDLKICVNKTEAVVFEALTYTIVIKNISDKLIENITLLDHKSFLTSFIVNTLYVNTKNIICNSPVDGLYLGSLLPCDEIIISFQMLINENSSSKYIYNFFEIAYDYLFNIELPPTRIVLRSFSACTYVKALCKQFNILSALRLPIIIHNLAENIYISEDISLCIKKLVATPVVSTNSPPLKSCLRLILIGTITYTVLGTTNKSDSKSKNPLYINIFTDSFITSILVPKSMNLLNIDKINNINFQIESYQKCKLTDRKLLVQTLVMVKIH